MSVSPREILISKLNVIDEFYGRAAQAFRETIATLMKYEEEEMDPVDGASPSDEIQKCYDFLNLLGQSCLCLMSTAVDNYLEDFARKRGKPLDLSEYKDSKGRSKKIIQFYKGKLHINMEELRDHSGLPFDLSLIKEIIDVRNTIQHENRFWDLTCWHPKGFQFSGSVFSGEPLLEIPVEGTEGPPRELSTTVSITAKGVREARARVEAFAQCLERADTSLH